MFPCKYPIICSPMNKVSDYNLALACFNAGIMPSFYLIDPTNKQYISYMITRFMVKTKTRNFCIATNAYQLDEYEEILLDFKPAIIELISDYFNGNAIRVIKRINDNGTKVFVKLLPYVIEEDRFVDIISNVDGIIVKGQDGAGRTTKTQKSFEDIIKYIHDGYPDKLVIPSGGISTKEQINNLMDAGAYAVGIGTLFAVSEESCVSKETKLKMIESGFKSTIRMNIDGGESVKQNALLFSYIKDTDNNNTSGLVLGIKSAKEGLIFMGKGIDSVDRIKTVEESVKELV